MNQDQPVSFRMYRSVVEEVSGAPLPEGKCSWCGFGYAWNKDRVAIVYDVFDIGGVSVAADSQEGFQLCETCGDKFAELLKIPD